MERCKFIHGINGNVFQLSERSISDIKSNVVNEMGRQCLRTICLAYVDHVRASKHSLYCQSGDTTRACKLIGDEDIVHWDDDASFRDLTCVAIFGIQDPVRTGVSFTSYLAYFKHELNIQTNLLK